MQPNDKIFNIFDKHSEVESISAYHKLVIHPRAFGLLWIISKKVPTIRFRETEPVLFLN